MAVGARIAGSFVLDYKEGSELCVLDGDSTSEPDLWSEESSGGYHE